MDTATLSPSPGPSSSERGLPVDGWVLFGFVSALYVGTTALAQEVVLTEQLYYNTYGERLAADRIRDLIAMREQYAWVGYVLTPLFVALRVAYTALCLSVGAILAEYRAMSFRRLFKAALLCEGVFLLQSTATTAWSAMIAAPETLREVGTALPTSAAALVDPSGLPRWALYPLQALNLFEVLYVAALSGTLAWMFGTEWETTALLTAASYGLGLLLWIVAATFFLVQIS
ncbi:MAG: hypothetical protein ABEL97_02840 [Salinibacter sp.]